MYRTIWRAGILDVKSTTVSVGAVRVPEPPGLVSTTGMIEVVLPPVVWLVLLVGVVVVVVVVLVEVGELVFVLDGVTTVPPVVVVVVPPVVVFFVPPVVVLVVPPVVVGVVVVVVVVVPFTVIVV
jgi:hypothetical protein